MRPSLPDLAIVGPSATGKTALAAELADEMSEVALASLDALAVYREMDIGTEKPSRKTSPASRHPWALVDLAEPSEEFSVAEFQAAAGVVATEAHARAVPVVYAGGSGLYQRAVVDALDIPPRFPEVAASLAAGACEPGGPERLHERLRELDPVAAGRMEPSNSRRVVRALEVTIGSGRRYSDFGPGLTTYPPSNVVMAGISVPRPELDRRLQARLGDQIEEGLVAEVESLRQRGEALSRTAREAIGYREMLAFLEGRLSLEAASDEV
ncbi:MAG: tRNA (adenosine(37)-N6)-dimethylallyltransferase MiaA, partial [Acidimicrobiales bacterium]